MFTLTVMEIYVFKFYKILCFECLFTDKRLHCEFVLRLFLCLKLLYLFLKMIEFT